MLKNKNAGDYAWRWHSSTNCRLFVQLKVVFKVTSINKCDIQRWMARDRGWPAMSYFVHRSIERCMNFSKREIDVWLPACLICGLVKRLKSVKKGGFHLLETALTALKGNFLSHLQLWIVASTSIGTNCKRIYCGWKMARLISFWQRPPCTFGFARDSWKIQNFIVKFIFCAFFIHFQGTLLLQVL